MMTESKDYQAQTQKWVFPIEQSIRELCNLIREDVRQVINETLSNSTTFHSSTTSDPLADEIAGTDYLTVDQATALLHVSKPTLHRYRKEHDVNVSRVGRRVLFKKSELIEAIKVKPKTRGGKYILN